MLTFAPPAELDADDDEHRARAVALTIPVDADLDDEGDVIRALYLRRWCTADFAGILPAAIELARASREARA